MNFGSTTVIFLDDWARFFDTILLKEGIHLAVATHLHLLELLFGPSIHRNRPARPGGVRCSHNDALFGTQPDETDVHTQTTMLTTAFETEKSPIRYRSPLRIATLTVRARLHSLTGSRVLLASVVGMHFVLVFVLKSSESLKRFSRCHWLTRLLGECPNE